MKKIALTLMALAAASAGVFAADTPGEEAPKPKPIEDALWEKALADNAKAADTAYGAYQKALADASTKVQKALEANIKDLNDPKKFGALGMKERAAAIAALEERIKAVKEQGAVGEAIVAARNVDLMGDKKPDLAKAIVGEWRDTSSARKFVFLDNKSATIVTNDGVNVGNGKWSIENGKISVIWEKYGKEVIAYEIMKTRISSETHGWIGIK